MQSDNKKKSILFVIKAHSNAENYLYFFLNTNLKSTLYALTVKLHAYIGPCTDILRGNG